MSVCSRCSTPSCCRSPLLRRLEKQELLTSEWNTDEARPRKFYRTSAAGETLATRLLQDWSDLSRTLTEIDGDTK